VLPWASTIRWCLEPVRRPRSTGNGPSQGPLEDRGCGCRRPPSGPVICPAPLRRRSSSVQLAPRAGALPLLKAPMRGGRREPELARQMPPRDPAQQHHPPRVCSRRRLRQRLTGPGRGTPQETLETIAQALTMTAREPQLFPWRATRRRHRRKGQGTRPASATIVPGPTDRERVYPPCLACPTA
jgi:hypothetical protein